MNKQSEEAQASEVRGPGPLDLRACAAVGLLDDPAMLFVKVLSILGRETAEKHEFRCMVALNQGQFLSNQSIGQWEGKVIFVFLFNSASIVVTFVIFPFYMILL